MNLLNKYNSIIGLVLLFLISCQPKHTSKSLLDYAKEQNIEIKSTTKAVFVLSNIGCITCNRAIFNLAADYLNQEGVQYIVTANGGLLDIRPFLEAKNVSFDKKQIIHNKELIKSSGVFFLNERQDIDTLVNIEAKDIQKSLEYIKQRLSKLKK